MNSQSVEDVISVIDKFCEVSWREDELIRVLCYLSRYLPRNILMTIDNRFDFKVLNVRVNNNELLVSYVYKKELFKIIVESFCFADIDVLIGVLAFLSKYADNEFLDDEGLFHRLCYGTPLYSDSDVVAMMMDLNNKN